LPTPPRAGHNPGIKDEGFGQGPKRGRESGGREPLSRAPTREGLKRFLAGGRAFCCGGREARPLESESGFGAVFIRGARVFENAFGDEA
jgi:hypothetical protein